VQGSADPVELLRIVRLILGKTCWRVEFGYGDELDLDLGQRLLRTGGPLRDKSYGEYQLCILADDWVLSDPSGQQLASGSTLATYEINDDTSAETLTNYERERKEILARLSAIVDQMVASIEMDAPHLGLRVTFRNSLTLTVFCRRGPDPGDWPKAGDDDEPMACWELYLPDGSLADVSRERAVPDWPLIKVLPEERWSVTSWGGP